MKGFSLGTEISVLWMANRNAAIAAPVTARVTHSSIITPISSYFWSVQAITSEGTKTITQGNLWYLGFLWWRRLSTGETQCVGFLVACAAVRARNFGNRLKISAIPATAKAIIQGIGILCPAAAFPLRAVFRFRIQWSFDFRFGNRMPKPDHEYANQAKPETPCKAAVVALAFRNIFCYGSENTSCNNPTEKIDDEPLQAFSLLKAGRSYWLLCGCTACLCREWFAYLFFPFL